MSERITTRKPRTVERRVQHLFVQHRATKLDYKGGEVEVLLTTKRGELATFTLPEAARLDALGALAPEGHTAEMIAQDIARNYEAYTTARQGVDGTGSAF